LRECYDSRFLVAPGPWGRVESQMRRCNLECKLEPLGSRDSCFTISMQDVSQRNFTSRYFLLRLGARLLLVTFIDVDKHSETLASHTTRLHSAAKTLDHVARNRLWLNYRVDCGKFAFFKLGSETTDPALADTWRPKWYDF
jgi:hypothetical protein